MKNAPKEFDNIEDIFNDEDYFKSSTLDTIKKWFTNKYYVIRNFFKYNVILRMKYKIDPRDTWELDIVITKKIVKTLCHLKGHEGIAGFDSILEALGKYMDDHDYSNYHEAETAYRKLYNIISHDLIEPYHSKFIKFVLPRLEYLKANNHGYPEFTPQKLKKKGLTKYINQSQELQWDSIQADMISKFKSDDSADKKEAFRILTEVVFNLWD
jgi:hypothetical protein